MTFRSFNAAWRTLAVACLVSCGGAALAARAPTPIEVRVVVVTAFEIGADTGDKAGEFQAWAQEMPQKLPFPQGYRDLRYDPERKVLLLSTGIGSIRAASSTMALGLDPRFDLSHAYWLVAAIAGTNPDEASIGSAAWIGNVIDTDYAYVMDGREIPAGWTTGIFPRERMQPYQSPLPHDTSYNLFPLNTGLRDWAFQFTRAMPLADGDDLRRIRGRYVGYAKALEPPKVITGDEATGQSFWHGALMNAHTERWTSYWTQGHGRFVMTAMEDSGVVSAVQRLARSGRADAGRVMVLRTGSNYSMQPPGVDAATSFASELNGLSGLQPALDAAHQIGRPVVDEISGHWARYRDRIPVGAKE